jgi:hypothetical protein
MSAPHVFIPSAARASKSVGDASKLSLSSAEHAARDVAAGESLALIRAFCALKSPPQRPKRRLRRKIFHAVETAWRLPSSAPSKADWHDTSSCRTPYSWFEWCIKCAQFIGTFAIPLFV